MRAALTACADFVFECQDGQKVLANKYTLLLASSLLFEMCEEYPEMSTLSLPSSSKHVQLTVDVIHRLHNIQTLSLHDVSAVLNVCDILKCQTMYQKCVMRLWNILRKEHDAELLLKYADIIIHDVSIQRDFLNIFKTLHPIWKDFKNLFENVCMSESLGKMLVWRLGTFFPPHLVFEQIMKSFPGKIPLETALNIFAQSNWAYSHPDEAVIQLHYLKTSFPEDRLYLKNITHAFEAYDISPGSHSKLSATTLEFSNTQRASVLVKIRSPMPRSARSLRVSKFCRLTVDQENGTLNGCIYLERLAKLGGGTFPLTCQHIPIRIMTFERIGTYKENDVIESSHKVSEFWHTFSRDGDVPILDLGNPTTTYVDSAVTLSHALSSQWLQYIRLDIFYSFEDIREMPIF
jgi:hypothetical protein